jgi:hypothetical protein
VCESSVKCNFGFSTEKSNELNEVVITNNCKINRQDAEVSFELKAAEIQEIPVEGRDI